MRAARTVKAPVVSPALSAGAVATPELSVRAVATFSPPVNVASVSPTIVKRIRTLATPLPAAFSALVLICSANASPAMAVSFAVPESSRWSTDWVGVTGGDGAGGVGVPDGGGVVDGGVWLGELGMLGLDGFDGFEGNDGEVFEPPLPVPPSLRLPGTVPVPSGISWVPLR